MKLLKVLPLFIALFLVASCSSDDDSNDNNEAQDGQLIATVDGESFVASGMNATAATLGGVFTITGIDANGNTIVLAINNINGEDIYDLATSASVAGGVYFPTGATNSFGTLLEGGAGTLTITELDEDNALVSGTFSFTGIRQEFDEDNEIISESVEVTEGSFTNLTISGGLPDGANDNILTALVDGETFSANNIQVFETTLAGQTSIGIIANDTSTNQNISITFGGEIIIGTFDLESFPFGNTYVATYSPDIANGGGTFGAQSGSTVTIDTYNETSGELEGSFQFVAGDLIGQDDTTFTITEGVFSVTVQ